MPLRSLLFALALAATLPPLLAATPARSPAATRDLIAVIQSNTAPLFERARACGQLTIFGTEEAVPALAALLPDARLSHYAREALEAMPYPAAGAALRASLNTLGGDLLIGVVNSVGLRRDALAVDALLKLANNPASGAAPEAMLALGRIGAPETTSGLQRLAGISPDPTLRAAAAEACLLIAGDHLALGRRDAAIVVYDFIRAAKVPPALQLTALRGALLARGPGDLSLLLAQLRSADSDARDTALRATRDLPGSAVTSALMAELDRAAPAIQALLVVALADRNDSHALPALERAAKSNAEEVRLTALKALGSIGGDSSVSILLQTLLSSPATPAADIAQTSLVRLKSATADREILQAIPSTAPAVRVKLIGLLGDRHAESAIDALLQLARDPAPEIRHAALRALALAARPLDQPALIQLALAMPTDEARTLADRALAATAMKLLPVERRADAVLAAFRQAPDDNTKIALLRPLGAIVRSMGTNHEACFVVTAVLTQKSAALREAALRCLADWPDAAPSVTLLEHAARPDTPSAEREIALQGALRLAGNVAAGRDRSPLEPLAIFRPAGQLVHTREEKLMLVSGLGSVKRFESFQLLQPYLADPAVQTEAALAVVQIAPALLKPPHADEVKRTLEKIAATEKDDDTKRKAARLAQGLNVARGLPTPPGKGKGKQKAAATVASATPSATDSPRQGPLFNGTDLAGWEGNPGVWRVRDGAIVGGSLDGNPRNEFLATTRPYRNFALKLEYKLVGTEGFINGGVQFRSVRIAQPPNEMSGYQGDIGAGHSGCLYDESRRKNFLARATDEQIKRLEKPGEWNRYEVRCQGSHIELRLNGEKTVSYEEPDSAIAQEGLIALQIHGKCKAEIAFRNLELAPLP